MSNSDVLSAQMLTILQFEHLKFILTNIMEIHVKNFLSLSRHEKILPFVSGYFILKRLENELFERKNKIFLKKKP